MNNQPFAVKDSIREFVEQLKSCDSIPLDEMPEYRLFISQIEEFFDKKLGRNAEDDEERKTISKTMIQNYIKDGLIMPPEGKSYNRSHIILLAIIYNLKSILTIRDIKKLLLPILEMADDDSKSNKIQEMYNTYYGIKETFIDRFFKLIEQDMELIDSRLNEEVKEEWDELPLIMLVLTLITQANLNKRLAERIIELYFKSDDHEKDKDIDKNTNKHNNSNEEDPNK